MISYIIRKFVQFILTVILVITIVFIGLNLSGDPIKLLLPPTATEHDIEILKKHYGLDAPLMKRYFVFLFRLVGLDFGVSLRTSEPALQSTLRRFKPTLLLAFSSLTLATLLALPVGILGALFAKTRYATFIEIISIIGISTPIFWIGLIFILIFSVFLRLFPTSGYGTFRHLVLPTLTICSFLLPNLTKIIKINVLNLLHQPFIITARAKGLAETSIILKHVLKNAAIPILTQLMLQLRFVIGGSVVVESIFGWPGLGQLLTQAAYSRDYPVVTAAAFFITLFIVAVGMILDFVYVLLDPRLKLQ